ncbi:flagellar biosynthetic protein FliP [[Clostridium] symbiosum]|jgi:flagellar biosynthetic protein FliP|uniref:Flagellar biosynthetic protein FliP n=4 Tax=Lachnospirales TaxID=3085636 RepID=R0BJT8_9FIRM|nr:MULTISPECIES: flagellar type III secretion system pore protein FliP [Clostridia]ENZ45184.1 flagellar biosynthetic protein FliP [Enterocloster bolteae 90B8]ERI74073.1 flagellar biosynthetic protein FliP [[Clostridium] symbiosum ATCC 14940]MBC5710515.1 flagellar type III secretion system pore protein FliP [Hungatella hominis]SUY60870.1 flagellar biosynthetic protein FliP [[Clostridium] symbiosum]
MGGQVMNLLDGNNIPTLDIILLLTIIALLPSIVVMVTSFTRIIIILSFLRNAMGIQQVPPNVVLAGLSLFLTIFIMGPTLNQINVQAYLPYRQEQITQEEALKRTTVPLKEFMLRQTEKGTLNMYLDMAGQELTDKVEDLSLTVIVPSFMTSELKHAFLAGFLIYLPFLLIDMVTASILMSMGMVMLPPAMISLPFKLLLFIAVDGWELLFSSIVKSFY